MDYFKAFQGALVADAVAMPVHWYYSTEELERDYPKLKPYVAPKSPHPSSILFRSHYQPLNEKADILGEQAQYWGKQGVHYHQFLEAGENTLNLKLAFELYQFVCSQGGYSREEWAKRYIELMLNPSWHGDTYLEEYHRNFFQSYAEGAEPTSCARPSKYIGGLSQIPALLAGLEAVGVTDLDTQEKTVFEHVSLTHLGQEMEQAATSFVRLLHQVITEGKHLKEALLATDFYSPSDAEAWSRRSARDVVWETLSPACYLPKSFTAALFIAHRYFNNFEEAVVINARLGGDNCHRGVVIGSLLAEILPRKLVVGLKVDFE